MIQQARQAEGDRAGGDAVDALTIRMTAVETTVSEGRRRRDEQFATLTAQIAGLTAQIGELSRGQTGLLQAFAALQATFNARLGPPGPPPAGLIAP